MLHTDSPGNPPRLVLITDQQQNELAVPKTPCLLSEQFLEVFEQLTGWRAEFQESPDSYKRRQSVAMENEPVEGNFKVVDMSEAWPAKTPTVHRGRCDQLIGLFGMLMDELQATRIELTRAHSALEALSPGSVSEEEQLVDAFVPKFSSLLTQEPIEDRRANSDAESSNVAQFLYDSIYIDGSLASTDEDYSLIEDDENDFIVHQEVSGVTDSSISETWKDWAMGGVSGIAKDVYLDLFHSDTTLTICVGRIESSFGVGDTEAAIEIDPCNHRYRVSGDVSLKAFYIWDRRGGKMEPVDTSGDWQPVYPGAAIISSTCGSLDAPDPQAELSSVPTAEQMAKVLCRNLPDEEKVLVLKRV
ncbi:MAG: hypothetical protein AAFN77_20895 [Planctomycetota bacterium]